VDRPPVFQSDHPKEPTLKFGDRCPEPPTIVLLAPNPHRVFDHLHAPLAPKVRPLPQHLLFELVGEEVLGHMGG
jgi:hypothetical protein